MPSHFSRFSLISIPSGNHACFINGSLFTEVLPLCRCLTFLKANESPGLKTCFRGLWTCAQCAGGPLHEVFCAGSACTCTESTCFAVIALIAGAEGVVVLKGVSVSGTVGTVLELYWNCTALHHFQMSFRIWKTFDVQSIWSGILLPVLFPVLAWEIPAAYHVTYHVQYHSLFCLHLLY